MRAHPEPAEKTAQMGLPMNPIPGTTPLPGAGATPAASGATPPGEDLNIHSNIPPAAQGPAGLAPAAGPEAEGRYAGGGPAGNGSAGEGAEHESGPAPKNVQVFFSVYFLMTGLHGIHVIAGMTLFGWILRRAIRGDFSSSYFTPVDLSALYWHLVDVIWIFLFPLLYLIK